MKRESKLNFSITFENWMTIYFNKSEINVSKKGNRVRPYIAHPSQYILHMNCLLWHFNF